MAFSPIFLSIVFVVRNQSAPAEKRQVTSEKQIRFAGEVIERKTATVKEC